VNAVAFSANGRLIASAGEDGKLVLWDAATGSLLQTLEGQHAPLRSLAFNRNGSLLAGGAADGKVLVWDMATRKIAQDFAASATSVNAMAFDGAGKDQLFVGNEQMHVQSWNVRNAAR
jgi:WD40 repeat protein